MVYTDIQTLRGLDLPVDYGSGVEFADGLLDDIFVHQSLGLQLGLWLNGTQGCLDIISGKLDSNLMILFQYIEKSRASVVFLRLGYGKEPVVETSTAPSYSQDLTSYDHHSPP